MSGYLSKGKHIDHLSRLGYHNQELQEQLLGHLNIGSLVELMLALRCYTAHGNGVVIWDLPFGRIKGSNSLILPYTKLTMGLCKGLEAMKTFTSISGEETMTVLSSCQTYWFASRKRGLKVMGVHLLPKLLFQEAAKVRAYLVTSQ